MIHVKICGVMNIEQALATAGAGADFLGMVFTANSRRQVDVEKGAQIIRNIHSLDRCPETVGVFVNSPAGEVNRITRECRLDWAQLSGDETWEYCLDIEKPIIKALHISPESNAHVVLKQMEEGHRILAGHRLICLLDTGVKGAFGGTGKSFNWKLAGEISRACPVFIAGGLTPRNVGRLVSAAHPWGVDVSSGVETAGVKDMQKIKDFIQTVKSLDGRT